MQTNPSSKITTLLSPASNDINPKSTRRIKHSTSVVAIGLEPCICLYLIHLAFHCLPRPPTSVSTRSLQPASRVELADCWALKQMTSAGQRWAIPVHPYFPIELLVQWIGLPTDNCRCKIVETLGGKVDKTLSSSKVPTTQLTEPNWFATLKKRQRIESLDKNSWDGGT